METEKSLASRAEVEGFWLNGSLCLKAIMYGDRGCALESPAFARVCTVAGTGAFTVKLEAVQTYLGGRPRSSQSSVFCYLLLDQENKN